MRLVLRVLGAKAVNLRRTLTESRSRASVAIAGLYGLATVALLGYGAWSLGVALRALDPSPGARAMLASGLGLLLAFFVGISFSTDFFVSEGGGRARRRGDLEALLLLPLGPGRFFTIKTLERAMEDMTSWVFLFPALVGFGAGWLGPWPGIPLALFLCLALELPVSAAAVATSITLGRFVSGTRLKNLAQWLNLVPLLTMIGLPIALYALVPVASVPLDLFFRPAFHLLPTRWVAAALLEAGPDPSLAAWNLSALVAFGVGLWILSEAAVLRIGAHGFTPEEGPAAGAATDPSRRLFTGSVWKELTRIRRDQDFVANGIVLPVVISLLLAAQMGIAGSRGGIEAGRLRDVFLGGLVYFHAFGSMSGVGSEGAALPLLALLPTSMLRMLLVKGLLWGMVGIVALVPAYVAAAFLALPTPPEPARLAQDIALLGLASLAIAQLGVGLSAHFADPAAENLIQSARPLGKLLFLGLAAGLILAPRIATTTYQALASLALSLAVTASFLHSAAVKLARPDEPERPDHPGNAVADSALCLFAWMFLQQVLSQPVARWLGHPQEAGLMIGTGASLALGLATLAYHSRTRRPLPGLRAPLPWLLLGPIAGVGLAVLARGFLSRWLPIETLASEFQGVEGGWIVLGLCLTSLVAPVSEELFFRGFVHRGLVRVVGARPLAALASALWFGILHPSGAFVPVFLMGLAAALLLDRTGSLLPGILLHVAYNTTLGWHWIQVVTGLGP